MAKKQIKSNLSLEAIQSKYAGSGVLADILIEEDQELWVPSSSPVLNYVLGGGCAFGRIIEISGKESSGKCCGFDTYLFMPGKGIVQPKEDLTNISIGEEITSSEEGSRITQVEDTGTIKTLRIRTSKGYEASFGYDNHRIKVLDQTGQWGWVHVKDLRKGHLIPIRYNLKSFGPQKVVGDKILDADMAWVLGVLMGDGCLRDGFSLSCHKDDHGLIEKVEEYTRLNFKLPDGSLTQSKINPKKRTILNLQRHYPSIVKWLKHFPEINKDSHGKRVPALVLESPKEVQIAFLRGYFDADGSSSIKSPSLSISSVSKGAMLDVQQMLLNLGIVSSLSEKDTKLGDKLGLTYRLRINGYQAIIFRDLIGFSLERKQERLYAGRKTHRSPIFSSFMEYSNLDPVNLPLELYPYLESLTNKARKFGSRGRDKISLVAPTPVKQWLYGKNGVGIIKSDPRTSNIPLVNLWALLSFWDKHLSQEPEFKLLMDVIHSQCFFDYIEELEIKEEPTFDLEVDPSHSYISSGFISHNSLMALNFIAMAQLLGGVGIFVDAEMAFSAPWAEKNGVDINKLYLYQESSIEYISDFVAESCLYYRSILVQNEPLVLVIDSIAALDTIQAMNNSELDSKAEMGIRAKALYKMLRLRNRLFHKLGVTVILINQLRDSINTGFGAKFMDKNTTPGGNAPKFFASQRIYLEAKKQLTSGSKEKKHRYGVEVVLTVKKNKLSMPKTPRRFTVIFDDEYGPLGFSKYEDLSSILIKEGVIEKRGNSYFFDGDQVATSAGGLQKEVEDDRELRGELLEAGKILTVSQMEERLDAEPVNRYPIDGITFVAQSTRSKSEEEEEEEEDE